MEIKVQEYQEEKTERMYQLANRMYAEDWFAEEDKLPALQLIATLYNERPERKI
jgi:hypothetical protein